MKKIVVLLAVIALAAPLYAQDDVIIKMRTLYDPNPAGNWLVEVSYDASGASQLVRGFSFDLLLDDELASNKATFTSLEGYKTDVFSTEAAPGYGVYLGSITFEGPGDPCRIDEPGSPQAQSPDAYPGVGTSEMTVELASLYDPDDIDPKLNAPDDTGVLFGFRVDKDCSVKCVADTNTRGGLIMEDGSAGTLKLMSATYPADKYFRVSWGLATQCHGDANGDGMTDVLDWPAFRLSFGKTYPNAAYNAAGDFNRDGAVDVLDWPSFRLVFDTTPEVTDCYFGMFSETWPPF